MKQVAPANAVLADNYDVARQGDVEGGKIPKVLNRDTRKLHYYSNFPCPAAGR
jgi:hypothetical protein